VSVETGSCSQKHGTFVDGTIDSNSLTWNSDKRTIGYSFTGSKGTIGTGIIHVSNPGDELDAKGQAFITSMAARVDASNKMIAAGMVASAVTPVAASAAVTGAAYATATAAGWYYGLTGAGGGIVLGKYDQLPNYLDAAETYGLNAFNLPRLWPTLNRFGQAWTANRAFIDASLLRGQQIFLGTAPMGASGNFARELQYLTSRGFGANTWQMLKLPFK
jgi:hypothetical protein